MSEYIVRHSSTTVVNPPESLTLHQRAVNALGEIAVFTPALSAKLDAKPTLPRNMVPVLFRVVIEETRKSDGVDEYPEETAILEYALGLLEQEDENRTPEQDEFFAALEFGRDAAGMIRVKYAPLNVVVN